MPNEIEQAIADFEAGTITADEYYKIIDGTPDDTADTPQGELAAGASPDPAKADPAAKTDEPAAAQPKEAEPVILAKDGVHTIPYSELTAAREEARQAAEQLAILQAKLAESADVAEQLKAAQAADAAAGGTESVDELMAELAEEFPSTAKLIMSLQGQVKTLLEKNQQAEQARTEAERKQSAEKAAADLAAEARTTFDKAVSDIQPKYKEVEADPNFWEWFGKQPPYLQAAGDSADPKVIASIVTTYLESAKPAPAGDTAKTSKTDMKKVADAIAKAEAAPTVHSLGDIPGGSNPAHDELGSLENMSAIDMATKFSSLDAKGIENLLSRML